MDFKAPARRVALFPCATYEPAALDAIIERAAEFAGFPDIAGKRILVKPNLLKTAPVEKAVTTHPEFLVAVLRFLAKRGAARLAVGDSPSFQNGLAVAKATGIWEATRRNGAEWVDFVPGKPRSAPEARLVKSFTLASALEECDLVVNLPKLKTHRLTNYTGAIKNLFGLIPGLGKSGLHMRFSDKGKFGTMLVDLGLSITECFTFMDGIVAMQGEGPGDGDPFPLGLVLASGDAAALDWTAAGCIGYEPRKIPYLADALERRGWNPSAPEFEVGPNRVADVDARGFALLPYGGPPSAAIMAMPAFARPFIRKIIADRPIFHPVRCIGCSACVKICPASALELEKTRRGRQQIRINDEACITCFCCHEVCPAHAISIGKVLARMPREIKKP